MKRFLLFLLITEIFLIHFSFSQEEIKFRRLSINSGLSQSTVFCIAKDKKGFMWFGTLDGLNKYDGYDFVIYKHDNSNPKSLSDNYINDILEDKDGNLWIATQRGLDRLDRETNSFIHYKFDQEIAVRDLFQDSKGALWIGTFSGVYKFNIATKRYKKYARDEKDSLSLFENKILKTAEDQQGNIWVLTYKSLEILNPTTQKFKRYRNNPKDPKSVIGNNFRDLLIDSKNNIWIAARGAGISLYDRENESFTNFYADPTNPQGLADSNVDVLIEGNDGNIWIGTETAGINILNIKNKTFSTHKNIPLEGNSLNGNQVKAFYKDNVGNIWIGMWEAGINWMYNHGTKFDHYKNIPCTSNSLSSNPVKAILEDYQGNWLIGTNQGGINIYNPKKRSFSFYTHDRSDTSSLDFDYINALVEINKDTLAVGFKNGGMDFFNRNTKKATHFKIDRTPNFFGRTVNCILKDNNNDIWCGMSGTGINLYKHDTKTFVHYRHFTHDNTSLSNGVVFCIFEDKSKRIWVGTEAGLNLFVRKKGNFIRFKSLPGKKGSISHNAVNTIFQDSKGRLWFGTAAGLNLYNEKTRSFTSFNEKQGLPNSVIQGILEDDHGKLWISTLLGIAKFDPETKTCLKSFSAADGLQGKEFTVNACAKLKSGKMLFGGLNGFNAFHPDSIKDNPYIPPVVITDFQIFNKPVVIGAKDSPLQKHISETKEIILPYYQSVITFSYAALSFNSSAKNQYTYKLEGFDKNWNSVGNKRNATYTNLDPGEYTFKVKGSNNDGVWNDEGTSIKLIITPPFWKTWWFTAITIITIVGSAVTWYRSRINTIKKQKKLLEQQVKERTAEISIQKEELETQAKALQIQTDGLTAANTEIKDSIRAAEAIQQSLLPSQEFIKNYLPESFIFYKPKDVVSGDFYWFDVIGDKIIIAAVDCTGHGVSGAFMSINGHHLINQAIYPYKDLVASEVLDRLNKSLTSGLNQQPRPTGIGDGMDIALCILDKKNRKLQFAGANNSLYILRNKKIVEIKANKIAIGYTIKNRINTYTNHEVDLEQGDVIYIFSDGYADQMGGGTLDEKFMYNKFRQLFVDIGHENMDKQSAILEETLSNWRGNYEQLDDILVIGFKV